jgi:hypothetical protein
MQQEGCCGEGPPEQSLNRLKGREELRVEATCSEAQPLCHKVSQTQLQVMPATAGHIADASLTVHVLAHLIHDLSTMVSHLPSTLFQPSHPSRLLLPPTRPLLYTPQETHLSGLLLEASRHHEVELFC